MRNSAVLSRWFTNRSTSQKHVTTKSRKFPDIVMKIVLGAIIFKVVIFAHIFTSYM
jgi:hypothetical protein